MLENWRNTAYAKDMNTREGQMFWGNYFAVEKGIYEKILENPKEVVKGTVKELAEKFETDTFLMTGFLDGINDSLVTPNPIETMEEDTEVSLEFDMELLYKNMVDARADWLYELPQWDALLTEERRKELVKQVKGICEDAKVSIRNIRRDGLEAVKKAELPEDEAKGMEKDIQDLVNEYNKKIENMLKEKEQELLTV
jgi:hypothetical protein